MEGNIPIMLFILDLISNYNVFCIHIHLMLHVNFLLTQMETLVDHIKFDHGYNAKSPAIVNVSKLGILLLTCQTKFEL